MFSITPNPTFEATLTIIGQGREQTLTVTFRHMKRTDYLALLEKVKTNDETPAGALLQLLESWDADADLTKESIERLADNQPGSDWAILGAYSDALTVARKGN